MAKAQTSKSAATKARPARQPRISPAASTPQAELPPEVSGVFPPAATAPIVMDADVQTYAEGDIQAEDTAADALPEAALAKPAGFEPFLPVRYFTPAGTPDLRAQYVLPPPVIMK